MYVYYNNIENTSEPTTFPRTRTLLVFCPVLFDSYLSLKLLFFIGVQLLYNVVLVSALQQSKLVIRIHISTLFQISFPFRSPQITEQSSLCYIVGSHQLSILQYIVVYMCQSQSPSSSHTPSSPLGIHKFVLYICGSISALPIRSSLPFFQIPHISVII